MPSSDSDGVESLPDGETPTDDPSVVHAKDAAAGAAAGPSSSRRRFLAGAAGLSAAAVGLGGLIDVRFAGAASADTAAAAATAAPAAAVATPAAAITAALAAAVTSAAITPTIPLPTTTAPEQLRLTYGADPATEMTVSWSAPGTVAQPAPTLAYSTKPISADNRGQVIHLPDPAPLSLDGPRTGPTSISFADGLSGFTTFHYHVPLTGLKPNTKYYYEISDGASPASTADGSFVTSPKGRFSYRFTSFGDLATPTADHSASGQTLGWATETAYYTVNAIEDPADHKGPPLFQLINGDLSYADTVPGSLPAVWRDYGVNVARSATYRPWMPVIGNHEVELGVTTQSGAPSTTEYWCGPYGLGDYQARFTLPDNGLTNYDGNYLQGQFYSFQVGTVMFVMLDANDVTFQGEQITLEPYATFASGVYVPETIYTSRQYTGTVTLQESNFSLVPSGPQPNIQTQWLDATLASARADESVDMIVVVMHQCALSANNYGNGTDQGIRMTWQPLFDKYEVDLVLSGHEHCYQRSYPVRGFDNEAIGVASGALTTIDGIQVPTRGAVNTRRPTVVSTTPLTVNGHPAYNTSQGTVYYVLGGGGAGSTYGYQTAADLGIADPTNPDMLYASVWQTPNVRGTWEGATWSADTGSGTNEPHGYAIFDVDPGKQTGDTTITVSWWELPMFDEGAPDMIPVAPYSTYVYGRNI